MIETTVTRQVLSWPAVGNFGESTAVVENGGIKELSVKGALGQAQVELLTVIPDVDNLLRLQLIVNDLVDVLIPPSQS